MDRNVNKSTVAEKCMMGMGNVGSNLCWTFMSLFIAMYYTNSVGLAAATVGTVMLFSRFLDGVSDIIFGIAMEKLHFKMGKARPWFMICGPLLGIGMYLCFHVPAALTGNGKAIYVFLTYSFVAAVAYTIFNLAYYSLITLMSYDVQDRNMISIVQMIFVYVGVTVMSMVTPMLIMRWGGYNSQPAWGRLSTIYAILCAVLCSAIGLFVKEKQPPEMMADSSDTTDFGSPQKTRGNLEMLKILFSSKYTWLLLILMFAYYFSSGVAGVYPYYFTYVLRDFEAYGLVNTIVMPCTLVSFLIVPFILRKCNKEKLIIAGTLLSCLSRILACVFARNVMLFTVFHTAANVGLTPIMALCSTFNSDLIDYFSKVRGIHLEGLASAAYSVGIKIGTGLGSAIVGWGLAMVHFNSENTVQGAFTQNGIIFITNIIPLIAFIVMIVCIKMWDVRKVIENV